MRVNDENAQRAITVRKGRGGRGGGGNDGKRPPLPVFPSVLFPSQPDRDHAELLMQTCGERLKGLIEPPVVLSYLD